MRDRQICSSSSGNFEASEALGLCYVLATTQATGEIFSRYILLCKVTAWKSDFLRTFLVLSFLRPSNSVFCCSCTSSFRFRSSFRRLTACSASCRRFSSCRFSTSSTSLGDVPLSTVTALGKFPSSHRYPYL